MSGKCIYCKRHVNNIDFCTACNSYFCGDCWPRWPLHENGVSGADGLPHERVNPSVVQDIRQCMQEPDITNEAQLHQDDDEATWFGFDRDEGGEPILQEYRRYASIIMQSSGDRSQIRYPSLVSFIGRTGAGKSSLIKLLINLDSDKADENNQLYNGPVIGRSDSSVPTSADVHLYLSPGSTRADHVILCADCEGFEGAERNPVAVSSVISPAHRSGYENSPSTKRHLHKIAQGTKRALKWASREQKDFERVSKRGYTVAQMYPRIFYAFSDVIVWVLETPRTLEVIIEKLLEWAHENYSKSLNQPIKPHVIIAFNKSTSQTADDQWSELNATANLLDAANAQIHQNATFVRFAQRWKQLHYKVDTMKKLMECYYSSVHVVRLPQKDRYQLLHQQRQVLQDRIQWCCQQARQDKEERGLLTDVDEFGMYLSLAFDHFSETLDKPFNFVEASLMRNPLSLSFPADMLYFVKAVAERLQVENDIKSLFTNLTSFVASCILLNAARKKHIGRPEDWFGGWEDVKPSHSRSRSGKPRKRRRAFRTYRDICHYVVSSYFKKDLPCQGIIRSRFFRFEKRCILRQATHGSEHRTSETDGDSSPGKFEWKDDFDIERWDEDVLSNMNSQYGNLNRGEYMTHCQAVVLSHASICLGTYQSHAFGTSSVDTLVMHSTCVVCLFNPPQYKLNCGHILCLECCRDFGEVNGRRIAIRQCPLHKIRAQQTSPVMAPIVIDLPPQYSGLRALALDGGGVRGIVELCVLENIENLIGLPIQHLVDLVVGTSTGGIIALALGCQMRSVKECKKLFKRLVETAFTLRRGQKVQFVKRIQLLVKHSRYETRPLEEALKYVFDNNDPLFPQPPGKLRTGVLTTTGTGTVAMLCSNYNAMSRNKGDFIRYRPIWPLWELAVWEAARATSAAPGFFTPFSPMRDGIKGDEMIDGAAMYNNPAEVALAEITALSEEEELNPNPDFVLSIGTGMSDVGRSSSISQHIKSRVGTVPQGAPWLSKMFFMVQYQIKLNIDAEKRWQRLENSYPDLKGHLFRLNPDFKEEPPELDNVEAMPGLIKTTEMILERDERLKQKVREVSCVLVASSFYFEKSGAATMTSASVTELHGYIRCRLKEPEHIKQLGRFIEKAHRPRFLVCSYPEHLKDTKFKVNTASMIETGVFDSVETAIYISGDTDTTKIELRLATICDARSNYPISGFPRQLMRCDFKPA